MLKSQDAQKAEDVQDVLKGEEVQDVLNGEEDQEAQQPPDPGGEEVSSGQEEHEEHAGISEDLEAVIPSLAVRKETETSTTQYLPVKKESSQTTRKPTPKSSPVRNSSPPVKEDSLDGLLLEPALEVEVQTTLEDADQVEEADIQPPPQDAIVPQEQGQDVGNIEEAEEPAQTSRGSPREGEEARPQFTIPPVPLQLTLLLDTVKVGGVRGGEVGKEVIHPG